MADLTITETDVVPDNNLQAEHAEAAERIVAGEFYRIGDDGKAYKAVNTSAANADVSGMAVNTAEVAGQWIRGQQTGSVTIGSHGESNGTTYFLSGNAGKAAPDADVVSGDFVTFLFVVKTSTTIELTINASGASK